VPHSRRLALSATPDSWKGFGMFPRRFDEPSEVGPDQSVSDGRPEAARAALAELTRVLEERGFTARVVEPTAKPPFVRATSPAARELSENVRCVFGEGGELWFVYSWGDQIAPVRHVESAAERVGHILTPQGC
jgi:hypothetical protein